MDEILHLPSKETEASPRRSLRARLNGLGDQAEQRVEDFRQKHAAGLAKLAKVLNGRRLMKPLPFLAVMSVVGVAAVVGTVYTPSYVVSLDGVALGVVERPEDFEQVVDQVEARATDILGYDYHIDGEVTYDLALSERGDFSAAGIFETYLFNQIGEVMKSYVLSVNGQVIGAAADMATIESLLDQVKAPYINENTVSSTFVSNVQITHEYTPSSIEQDPEQILAALTANTTGDTTYTVQAGDTFMALAFENGMSMEEMEALNPGVDINTLMIGQELNIKETIPVLSVQTVEQVSYTQQVAPAVEEVADDSMYEGDTKVLQEGVNGENLVTADVTYINGTEESRNITSTTVVSEPVNKVVAVGTKERPSWLPTGSFIWPVHGTITSNFGYRSIFGSYSSHRGLDIATSYGTAIAAADGGTVVFAGRATGSYWSYGNLVIIDHGNGLQTYYAHCSSVLVSAGDKVYQGQTIARVGSTGRSTGNHCHFEVQKNGTPVNPYNYLG